MDTKINNSTIIYIGGFEMPDKNAAAHRVLNNSKILNELGYEIVFCGIDKQIKESSLNINKVCGFDSVPSKYPQNSIEWISEIFNFSHIKKVIEMYPNTRYVIAYNMHALPLKKLMKYCNRRHIKIIADITEWYENHFSLSPIAFIRWADTKIVMTKLQKKVDGIISISTFLTNYYKRFVKNIIQVPPLVDLTESIWENNSKTFFDGIEFVYTGNPGKNKDKINQIVDCFRNFIDKNFRLNIVGITKEQFLEYYPNYTDRLGIFGNKLIFLGRVTHMQSIQFLYQADYCIFIRDTTRKNMAGFPTKFVECFSTGVGIVTNNFSNILDYYPKNNFYVVNDLSNDDLNMVVSMCLEGKKICHINSKEFDYHNYIDSFKVFFNKGVL